MVQMCFLNQKKGTKVRKVYLCKKVRNCTFSRRRQRYHTFDKCCYAQLCQNQRKLVRKSQESDGVDYIM